MPIGTTKVSLIVKLSSIDDIFDEIKLKDRAALRSGSKDFQMSLQDRNTFPGLAKDLKLKPNTVNKILVIYFLKLCLMTFVFDC